MHSRRRALFFRLLGGFLVLSAPIWARAENPPAAQGILIEQAAFDSPALGRPLTGAVYIPRGAEGVRLPVVYLLHGTNSVGLDWVREALLPQAIDALIGAGKIQPMIAVMPDASNSWYADSKALGGPGDFATAISRDLVDATDRRFATRADRSGRALIGISMGGHGALGLAFARPDRFSVAASLSGAFWNRTDQSQIASDRIKRIFDGSFGVPFDRSRFMAASPFSRIADLKTSGQPLSIRLVTGDRERFNTLAQSMDLLNALREGGLDAEFRVTGGDHDWVNWAEALPDTLIFADRAFRAALK